MSDIPATWDDLKPGVKVKCIYNWTLYKGKTATIDRVDGKVHFYVIWDDPILDEDRWAYPSSFTVLQDSTTVATPPTVPVIQQAPVAIPEEPPFDFDDYYGVKS